MNSTLADVPETPAAPASQPMPATSPTTTFPPSSPEQGDGWKVCRVTSAADLTLLETEWRRLGATAGGPIEQYDWALACAETAKGQEVEAVMVSRGDEPAALVPLTIRRFYGARRKAMLGVDDHHEPMQLLYRNGGAAVKLAEALAANRWPVQFGRLPAETASLPALKEAFARGYLVVVRPQATFPFIPLNPAWQEPESQLSSRRRSDFRRAQRKAEKVGLITSEIIEPKSDQIDALLDEAFAVEAQSWKGLAGTAMACNPEEANFCRRYAHAACRSGILRLCFLRLDGQAIAMQVAMLQGGGFWLLKIGYDARYSQCSPGLLLLREAIAYAAEQGLKTFEFLGQSEPWIEAWTEHKRECVSFRAYPYNLRGAVALTADAAARAGHQLHTVAGKVAGKLRAVVKAAAIPVARCAARKYISGEKLSDAVRAKEQLAAQGLATTIGYWDAENEQPRQVADQYLAGLEAIAGDDDQNYLSIKLPSLGYSAELVREIAEKAAATGRRIHFDGMAPDSVDRTKTIIEETLAAVPAAIISTTLPGRWQRSVEDAAWVARWGLPVRVVKGEWSDPLHPQRDLRSGYLEVIDALAGSRCLVSVASHDPPLAVEAIRRLQAAGTPCQLELLYGLPMRESIRQAKPLGVAIRVYVPYGEAYMPYALSKICKRPRLLWWLARDLVSSVFRKR